MPRCLCRKCRGNELEHLGHGEMTWEQGGALLPQTPLTKRIFKLGFTLQGFGQCKSYPAARPGGSQGGSSVSGECPSVSP